MLSLIPARSPWPFVRALPTDWYNGNLTAESNVIPAPSADIAMAVSTRALSWCPISKTKIALVFAAVNAGVSKYYVQIVNFVDKKPVYSAPNYIADVKVGIAVNHPMMRVAKITDTRLVLSIPENLSKNGMSSQHSFALLDLNVDDSVTLVSRTAATTTASTTDSLVPQLPLLVSAGNGIAWYHGTTSGSRGQGSDQDYMIMYKLTMTGDTLAIVKARGTATYQTPSLFPLYSGKRKSRTGKTWSLAAANTGIICLDFDTGSFDDGRNAFYTGTAPSYTRNIVPIEGDKFIYFIGLNVVVARMNRAANTYIDSIATVTTAQSGLDFAGLTMEDAIWVDNTTFIVIAGVGTPPTSIGSNTINTPDTIAQMSTDVRMFVFRFDDTTNKVTLSSNAKLLGLNLSKQTYDNMLHNIDKDTAAIIGTFAPQGSANTTHQILILKSGVAPALTFDTTLWSQFSFRGDQAIEEVTQAPLLLNNASIVNSKLVNTSAVGKPMDKAMPFYLSSSEDFSVEGWLNMSSIPDAAALLAMYAAEGSTDFSFFFGTQSSTSVLAIINPGGTDPGAGRIVVAAPTFTLNADHHLAMCRVAGVLTLYLNGVAIYSAPNTSASFRGTEFLNIRNGAIGKRWNMRVFRGKSAYTAPFTPPTTLPVIAPEVYGETVANDIVFQACMRLNSTVNEATGEPITLSGGATVDYGRLNTLPSALSRFSAPCAYFGAGDFTMECKVRMPVNPATAESGIMGQYGNAFDGASNWIIWTSGSRGVVFYWIDNGGSWRSITASVPLPLNSDCHLVIEKVGTVITMYFDGVKVAEGASTLPFHDRSTARPLRNLWDNTSGTANTLQVTNIRIVKRAMYNGAVKASATFPVFPAATYSDAEAADIVFQAGMRLNAKVNEVTGQPITLTSATVEYERLLLGPGTAPRFSAECPYFGAADFTIECKIRPTDVSAYSGILSQWSVTAAANANSWALFRGDGVYVYFIMKDSNNGSYQIRSNAQLALNVDTHVVVERINGTITMYFNGVAVVTSPNAVPMANVPALLLRNNWDDASLTGNTQLTNIRIAKRALYRGTVKPLVALPRFKS